MAKDERKSKHRRYAPLRRFVQAVAFCAFIALLLLSPGMAEDGTRGGWLPRLSPLSGAAVLLASKRLVVDYWPALVLLALTFLLGRFFCGWICPLGTTIDVSDHLLKRSREKTTGRLPSARRLKYYLLAALLTAAALGAQATGWLDPLSIAVRSYVIVVHSYFIRLLVGLLEWMRAVPGLQKAATPALSFLTARQVIPPSAIFQQHVVFLFILFAILAFGFFHRRYWCRNLCPLGAVLSLCSDWSFNKRTVCESCISCKRCQRGCRMDCIGSDGQSTMQGECILCMDCRDVCPKDAVRFRRVQPAEQAVPVNLERRGLVGGAAAGVLAVPALKLNPVRTVQRELTSVIRPPGVTSEDEFLSRCVRCGECLRVCRTGGLQPSGLEAGLEGLWAPKLVPRIGYCDYQCTRCGNVCPSGAIPRLTAEEKWRTSMGKARIDTTRCIPWVGWANLPRLEENWFDCNCAVCEEVCPVPTKAIHFSTVTLGPGKEIRRPVIDYEACIGCGFCENKCPVTGKAAIRVEGRIQPLPEPPEPEAEGPDLASFFPSEVGGFRLKAKPGVFVGPDGLWEVMNGGGEPYLTLAFMSIAVGQYLPKGFEGTEAEDRAAEVFLWLFGASDDSFGAYAKDRSGKPTQADADTWEEDAAVWAWKGCYYVDVHPTYHPLEKADSLAIAGAILEKLGAEPAQPPEVVRGLPVEGRREGSVRYFRKIMLVNDIVLAPELLTDELLALTGKSEAACAAYGERNEEGISTVVVDVLYPDAGAARAVAEAVLRQYPDWKLTKLENEEIWKSEKGSCFSCAVDERRLRLVHFAASVEQTKALR